MDNKDTMLNEIFNENEGEKDIIKAMEKAKNSWNFD